MNNPLIRPLLAPALIISLCSALAITSGCASQSQHNQVSTSSKDVNINAITPLNGEWQLTGAEYYSNSEGAGEPQNWFDPSVRMVKLFTDSHFAYVSSRPNRTKISTHNPADDIKIKVYGQFNGGAGRYDLEDNNYTEHVEFCSVANYEGMSIPFTVTIDGDTLIQEGVYPMKALGFADRDGYLRETYKRLKD